MAGHRKCDHEALLNDIRSGMSYKAAGGKYGMTASAVSRVAQRNGIKSAYVCHIDKKIKEIEADKAWVEEFRNEWNKITRAILGEKNEKSEREPR